MIFLNVYDFDGTIYDGDSSVDFYIFALKNKPSIIRYFPKQVYGFLLYKLNKIDKTVFKEYFFSFLHSIDAEKEIGVFWQSHKSNIKEWYINQQKADDIIISASPYFLLEPICSIIGISKVLASNVDIKSGKFYGKNCKGIEKVKRLNEEYSVFQIDNFYSDSLSDQPLADISKNAFFVKKDKIKSWTRRKSSE